MQETFYQNSEYRNLSIKQRMQDSLYQTAMLVSFQLIADTGEILPDSRCSSFSIRQRMHETLYQTGDAGISYHLDSR